MQCLNCGDSNKLQAKYCGKCGARVGLLQPSDTLKHGDNEYVINKTFSKGGMGAVCLAIELYPLQRPCIIKELVDYFDPNNSNERQKAQDRFKREAQTLAFLNHPSIPKIYTFFSNQGHNYIVMEYVEGEDLEERITHLSKTGTLVAGKSLQMEIAIQYIIQIAKVLEYLGGIKPDPVIHQDIKPANIIISKNTGQAMLVDFGTARARFVTQPGGQVGIMKSSVYGTEGYAPPEQYKGQSEPGSDVYALASTLYHILTDDDPRNHPFQFPQLANLPNEVQNVLSKSLNNNINNRPIANKFREELEHIIDSRVQSQPIQAPKLQLIITRKISALLIFLILGLVIFAYTILHNYKKVQVNLHTQKGNKYLKSKDYIKARDEYNEVLKLDSQNSDAKKQVSLANAEIYFNVYHQYDRALEQYKLYFQFEPTDTLCGERMAICYYHLGLDFYSNGNYKQTDSYFNQGLILNLRFNLNLQDLTSQIAESYYQRGIKAKGDTATHLFAEALLYSEHSKAREKLGSVNRLIIREHSPINSVNASNIVELISYRNKSRISSVAFSPDGRYIANGIRDNTVKLWDYQNGKMIKSFEGHTDFASSVSFSLDGRYIASGSGDKTIKLWDISTGNLIRTIKGFGDAISVSFSPNGQYIASASGDSTFELWDVSTGNLIRTFIGHTFWVVSISFSPDGQYIVSGSSDKTVKLWDALTGNLVRTFTGHTDYVESVSFSPDGRYIASGSIDRTVKLWDTSTGNLIRTFTGNVTYSVSFSPNGQYIASGCTDGVRLWDVSTGNLIRTLTGHTNSAVSVSFSPDGRYIASGSVDMTIKLWGVK